MRGTAYELIGQLVDGFAIAETNFNFLNNQDPDYEYKKEAIKKIMIKSAEVLPDAVKVFIDICTRENERNKRVYSNVKTKEENER